MADPSIFTLFAPAERKSEKEIFRETKIISERRLVSQFLDSVQDILVVLNQERQIVYANRNLLAWMNLENAEQVCGLRFGEAIGCIHAREMEGGCGTSEYCRTCGVTRAILSSQNGQQENQECRIIRADGAALDLRVKTSPITIDGEKFVVLTAINIAHEKRLTTLEQVFFRDISATASGLQDFSLKLRDASLAELDSLNDKLQILTEQLLEEIATQRDISAAENNSLEIHTDTLNTLEIFYHLSQLFHTRPNAQDVQLVLDENAQNATFVSDRRLLSRVLGQMIKNALEASQSGEQVHMGCQKADGSIRFWVHNTAFMQRSMQLQIFQRSFTTKEDGRGLGTYTIKLLTEKYLKGQAHFTSTPENGTRFWIELPLFLE